MPVIRRAPEDVHRTADYSALTSLVRKGECAVFVGSGLSAGQYVSWEELIRLLCAACGVDFALPPENNDPTPLLQMADNARASNEPAYCQIIYDEFGPVRSIREAYYLLAQLKFSSYITINFDPLLHSARVCSPEAAGCPFQVWPALTPHDLGKNGTFYIHGWIRENALPASHDVVLTETDFADAYDHVANGLSAFLTDLFYSYPIVFLGCGLREPPLCKLLGFCKTLRNRMEQKYGRKAPPRYMLLPVRYVQKTDVAIGGEVIERDNAREAAEEERLRDYEITVIRYEPDDGHRRIEEILREWRLIKPIEPSPGFAWSGGAA